MPSVLASRQLPQSQGSHILDRTGHVCRVSGRPPAFTAALGQASKYPWKSLIHPFASKPQPKFQAKQIFLQRLGEKSGFLLAFSSF